MREICKVDGREELEEGERECGRERVLCCFSSRKERKGGESVSVKLLYNKQAREGG